MELQPSLLWSQFDALCQIPRASQQERCVQLFLCAWARLHGFDYRQDRAQPDCGNVVIYVPGRGTGVNSPGVVIQTHTDMVCVKDENATHDFGRDPIQSRILQYEEGDGFKRTVLMATGTTLGADNGIGVAAAMAVAIDPDILDCPPLELLFTVDEESGLTGVSKLDASLIHYRRLINLDVTELGDICISCAGGRDMIAKWKIIRTAAMTEEIPIRVYLTGLPSGHSGIQIHERRGNAIVMLLSEIKRAARDWSGLRLAHVVGGIARNIIPGNAEVWFWTVPHCMEALERHFNSLALRKRWHNAVPRASECLAFGVERLNRIGTPDPISEGQTRAILEAILSVPTGVQAWSRVVEGLVETSNNAAVVRTQDDAIEFTCLTRSAKNGAIRQFQELVSIQLKESGAVISYSTGYTCWEADMDNPLLSLAMSTCETVLGRPARVTAVHGGLECGVLKGHIPELQMISFGPDIRGAHTPRERVWLDSVPSFYLFLIRLLAGMTGDALRSDLRVIEAPIKIERRSSQD